jgi:hypothetical protein
LIPEEEAEEEFMVEASEISVEKIFLEEEVVKKRKVKTK